MWYVSPELCRKLQFQCEESEQDSARWAPHEPSKKIRVPSVLCWHLKSEHDRSTDLNLVLCVLCNTRWQQPLILELDLQFLQVNIQFTICAVYIKLLKVLFVQWYLLNVPFSMVILIQLFIIDFAVLVKHCDCFSMKANVLKIASSPFTTSAIDLLVAEKMDFTQESDTSVNFLLLLWLFCFSAFTFRWLSYLTCRQIFTKAFLIGSILVLCHWLFCTTSLGRA